ncbi:MAG: hypothetical protein IMZ53_02180, partial [Thermoplasmata archaeon]|nr:hypothetical protein [Thermoplasmata archaeon]
MQILPQTESQGIGMGAGLQSILGPIMQRQQQMQSSQQLSQILSGMGMNVPQGMTSPMAQQLLGQMVLQQQQGQQMMSRQQAKPQEPLSETQFKAYLLQKKEAGQMTPEMEKIYDRLYPITEGSGTYDTPVIATKNDKTGLPEGTVYQFSPKKELKIIKEPEGGFLEKDKIGIADTYRKEFNSLSAPYREIRDSYKKIESAAKDPSPAGDIAIIFNYMKILDPTSVVREGEFATAEKAAGVPVAVRNLWNKLITGEKIAFNRSDYVDTARKLYKTQELTQKNLIGRYSKL